MAQFSIHLHLTYNKKLKYHNYFDPAHGGGRVDVSVTAGDGDKTAPRAS